MSPLARAMALDEARCHIRMLRMLRVQAVTGGPVETEIDRQLVEWEKRVVALEQASVEPKEES